MSVFSNIYVMLGGCIKRRSVIAPTPDKIVALKGKYAGRRCFIVGTAPSLKNTDLSVLNDEFVFSVNRGYDLTAFGLNSIDAYVIGDMLAFADYGDKIDADKFGLVFLRSTLDCTDQKLLKASCVYESIRKPRMYKGYFQFDLTKGVYTSHTIVLDALQIAVYLGFSEIYFVGVDLKFEPENLHFYESSAREVGHSVSHSQRFAGKMLEGFAVAKDKLQPHGVCLYNAGVKGCLPCLEWVDLATVVKQGN